MKKALIRTIIVTGAWLLIGLLSLVGATYAWFSFSPDTMVEPMASTISEGETALYISNDFNGTFDVLCSLKPYGTGALEPISTPDLEHFYEATMQNRNGMMVSAKDISDRFRDKSITGTLYLKSLKNNCSVYLYRQGLQIQADQQTLGCLRLGLRFINSDGSITTHIFSLNELLQTAEIQEIQTVPTPNTVITGIHSDGTIAYTSDPGKGISRYFADAGGEGQVLPGAESLCTIQANEIVTVEYYLYLEGCDSNCINAVQNQDVNFQLSFAGVSPGEEY